MVYICFIPFLERRNGKRHDGDSFAGADRCNWGLHLVEVQESGCAQHLVRTLWRSVFDQDRFRSSGISISADYGTAHESDAEEYPGIQSGAGGSDLRAADGGPIPDGPHDGDLFFPKGITGRARLAEIVGKVKGVAAGLELEKLTILGRQLWKGKVFYRNERVLRNRIDHLELLAEFFPNPAEEAKVRELTTNGKTDQLYFPAKLYCGQSLMDSRRESIIIDYAFTDEIEGYHEIPDKLAGREGLLIRDEVRMVRPGFYLGRAYMGNSFLLNFTVYNDAAAKAGSDDFAKTGKPASEDCW